MSAFAYSAAKEEGIRVIPENIDDVPAEFRERVRRASLQPDWQQKKRRSSLILPAPSQSTSMMGKIKSLFKKSS